MVHLQRYKKITFLAYKTHVCKCVSVGNIIVVFNYTSFVILSHDYIIVIFSVWVHFIHEHTWMHLFECSFPRINHYLLIPNLLFGSIKHSNIPRTNSTVCIAIFHNSFSHTKNDPSVPVSMQAISLLCIILLAHIYWKRNHFGGLCLAWYRVWVRQL